MHVEEGDLGEPDWGWVGQWLGSWDWRIGGRGLTEEEGYHLGGGDALVGGDVVWEIGERGPDCCDHDLDHVASVDGLNCEPEHCEDDARDDGDCESDISLYPTLLVNLFEFEHTIASPESPAINAISMSPQIIYLHLITN